jgi:protein-L-isoaspartate(D-aspartate) O-methyltransferase
LADQLEASGCARSEAVKEAFRTVPRHQFLPAEDPVRAYRDEAFVTHHDAQGRPTSSSSQPTIMALMLEQLALERGQRVLEIGAGTGYNAALLAELVGPAGEVVTVDIDEAVADEARGNLDRAGYGQVRVVMADGAEGLAERAPFDRMEATVGVWDLAPAWFEQLADNGRLLVPLCLRGLYRSVAFVRQDDRLVSDSALACGFMPIRGVLAQPHSPDPIPGHPGAFIHLDGVEVDVAVVADALRDPGPTPTRACALELGLHEALGGLGLWLVLHDLRAGNLAAWGDAATDETLPKITWRSGLASTIVLVGERGLAALVPMDARTASGARSLGVRAYGPEGPELLARLVELVERWVESGQRSTHGLQIAAFPRHTMPHPPIGEDAVVLDKPRTTFVLTWAS